ncbi:MAG TPA: cyclic nucleotide-binding domain-containing protein [Chloroflexota bacterium]|jgi:CRP-like cAMP-binding protein|nr:cyclic nucleotide-binding domain-containing protein [Chloroflexota bacterium]
MPDSPAAPAATDKCVCRHSRTAHTLGKGHGCSFCSCPAFRDPSETPPPPPEPLSEQAEKALAILADHAEFRNVAKTHLDEIARWGKRRLFLAGQDVMLQGDPSDSLHILVKGAVKVERELPNQREPLFLAELAPGDIVGEMGVLNGELRTATVTAIEDSETLEIPAKPLKEIFQDDPDVLIAVMKVINERLRTTDDVVELNLKVALAQLSDKR